jgi:large subunit ribosomal protein L24
MATKADEKKKYPKLKIKVGDMIQVIAGKDKGERGKVVAVHREDQRVLVEGLNLGTKHVKPRGMGQSARPGDRVSRAMPLHVSNVMLIDPKTDKPTRVGRKVIAGELTRYTKDSGEQV